MTNKVKRVN